MRILLIKLFGGINGGIFIK